MEMDRTQVRHFSPSIWPFLVIQRTAIAVGLMKMGNIGPRVGLEPTSLAFRANV